MFLCEAYAYGFKRKKYTHILRVILYIYFAFFKTALYLLWFSVTSFISLLLA